MRVCALRLAPTKAPPANANEKSAVVKFVFDIRTRRAIAVTAAPKTNMRVNPAIFPRTEKRRATVNAPIPEAASKLPSPLFV